MIDKKTKKEYYRFIKQLNFRAGWNSRPVVYKSTRLKNQEPVWFRYR